MLTRCFLLLLLSAAPAAVFAGDVFNGKKLYERHCMGCHGSNGEGMMPGLPNFARGEQLFKSDRELEDAVRDGNGVMPSFSGILDDTEINDVVAFLRTFL